MEHDNILMMSRATKWDKVKGVSSHLTSCFASTPLTLAPSWSTTGDVGRGQCE